ncbi:hypothetical protein Fmac_008500 [Flemingia macrophylla]|uniref:Uncharacterized protein n=1 Tax=Flemingia macrophylla TaxID=520843 RepID=A0ABD1MXJ5_9FABA
MLLLLASFRSKNITLISVVEIHFMNSESSKKFIYSKRLEITSLWLPYSEQAVQDIQIVLSIGKCCAYRR